MKDFMDKHFGIFFVASLVAIVFVLHYTLKFIAKHEVTTSKKLSFFRELFPLISYLVLDSLQ